MNAAEQAMLKYLQHAYQGDAIWRPSNADRWIPCPGSVQLIARLPRVPQRPGAAARQGSGAHKLAEIVLTDRQGLSPEDFIGRYVSINDDPKDLVFVDQEMADKIGEYVAIVEGYRSTPGTEVFIEHKLSLAALDPSYPLLNECRGTGDVVAVNRRERWLGGIDLKYGVGVPVPGNSPQLKTYLLMIFLTFADGQPWNWGSTTVFQPRLPVPPYNEDDHFKTFIFKPEETMGDFLGIVLESMHAALGPNPKLQPSLKSCRWCEARSICPALRDAGLSVADYQPATSAHNLMSRMTPIPPIVLAQPGERPSTNGSALVLRAPADYDTRELSSLLDKGEMFAMWFEGLKHRAAQLLQAGIKVPDWYLKPRTGNRRWVSPREVTEEALLKLGLKPTDIYTDPKLKSPKQVEDVLPKLLKGAIDPLVERPPGAPTLVRGTDPDVKHSNVAIPGPIQLEIY